MVTVIPARNTMAGSQCSLAAMPILFVPLTFILIAIRRHIAEDKHPNDLAGKGYCDAKVFLTGQYQGYFLLAGQYDISPGHIGLSSDGKTISAIINNADLTKSVVRESQLFALPCISFAVPWCVTRHHLIGIDAVYARFNIDRFPTARIPF